MFKSTKTFGYFSLVIGVFLVSLLIFVDYDDDNIFFFIELFMIVYFLIIPFQGNFIIVALKLIELDLYVGDTISTYYSKNRDNEEDGVLIEITFWGPVLSTSKGAEYSKWGSFVHRNVGYVNTKTHAPSKRIVEQIFIFDIKDMDKIKRFMEKLQKRLEKENSLKDVSVKFFYEDDKSYDYVNSVGLKVVGVGVKAIAYVDAGRENFYNARIKINGIALDTRQALELD